MERISAARAMEWSVELERGLRSKKPGFNRLEQALKGRYLLTDKFLLSDVRRDPHLFDPSELYLLMSFLNYSGQLMRDLSLMESRPVEAILQMGPRIEQWSKEHSYPTEVLKMFGLVPGEDRLFANTILLRLAHAFKTGDTHTRLCVLKVFLLELRYRRRKGKTYNGILAKQRVSNILELLKRVKIVFDAGDVDSKALALRLLGCWADIAKGSAEIRYMILSKLDSINVLEAKASLFAAGCISELSEDFASVALEIMINMMNSKQTSSSIKLAGARTISRMGYSSVLACKAYKAGKKLILESSHEEFIVGMLMSLTKLASKSLLLISEQVDLLLQFISQNSASCVQAMALRCLYCLLAGGVCRFPVNASVVTMLVNLLDATNPPLDSLDATNLPLDSQCKLLQMLRKLFQSSVASPCMDIPEFAKLVQSVEIAAQSPITSKRFLALHLLVDISRNHRVAMEMIPEDNILTPLPNRVILLVIDLIVGLVKTVLRPCETASELKKECQSLLNLLIIVVEEYPTLGVLALDKIRLPVEYMVDMCIGDLNSRTLDSSVHGILGGEKHAPKLVFYMYKFVESCIETLDEANSISAQVHQLFEILVNVIRQRSLFSHDICTIFLFVLLHSRFLWAYMRKENNGTCNVAKNLGISPDDNWVKHERHTLEYTKKMMAGRDNWAAYRAGKQAACQGAWFTVAYMFWQLTKKVQSDNCSYWLKSLSLFAQAESTILILILPEAVSEIWTAPCGSVLEEVGDGVTWNANSQNSIEKLTEAYSGVRSAAEMLASATTLDQTFYFQRWFLALRAKTLEAVVDIQKILSSDPCKSQNIGNCRCFEGSTEVGILGPAQHVHLLALFLTRMSFRLNRLVQEFELLATSFMGIDSRSFRSISRLVLNCSLLAFCTGFVIYYPHLQFFEKSMLLGLENLEKCSHVTLLKDVIERLWHIEDDETSKNLKALLALIADPKTCFNLHPRTLISRVGHRERETLVVCKFAVSRILHIHEETNKLKDEGVPCQVSRTGVQLLSDILKMWIGISFQAPNYFFQVRPCVGAELFAFSADTRRSDEISVLPGYHLSLSLCLQLRNAPTVLPARITKLYCILSCKPTYRTTQLHGESKERMQSDSQVWETDDALDLNDKLMLFVTEGMKRTGRKRGRTGDDSGFVWSCVCFETNERGQGFSTCLLDVSTFPLGSYRIKWHSCCLDSQGSYWSLLPLNTGPLFTVKKPIVTL